jgi:hypothetical protein
VRGIFAVGILVMFLVMACLTEVVSFVGVCLKLPLTN